MSASRIMGFTPEPELSPRVKIPNAEDEMVPPPVADRMDPHFSPSAIGNGSHSQVSIERQNIFGSPFVMELCLSELRSETLTQFVHLGERA